MVYPTIMPIIPGIRLFFLREQIKRGRWSIIKITMADSPVKAFSEDV